MGYPEPRQRPSTLATEQGTYYGHPLVVNVNLTFFSTRGNRQPKFREIPFNLNIYHYKILGFPNGALVLLLDPLLDWPHQAPYSQGYQRTDFIAQYITYRGNLMSERNPYIAAYVPEGSIRVSCIQHTNVSVSDVERSQEWYKKVFGAEWTEEQPRYLKLGTSEVHIAVRGEANPHPRNHFAVEVENWDAWLNNFERLGESLLEEPNTSGGKLRGFVNDPDGNRIEVMWHADWHKIY